MQRVDCLCGRNAHEMVVPVHVSAFALSIRHKAKRKMTGFKPHP